jgi:hypothetical protein
MCNLLCNSLHLVIPKKRPGELSQKIVLSRVCSDYIRRVLDLQLDLLDHTQLHTITVYTLLQLTTVHYNTCRVFTLYLHSLPLFQYRRIRSPATLQLFSEDCCLARILTRNWNCPRHLVNSLLSCQLTLMASLAITH